MTYNLLYGSHERDGDTLLFQDDRARAAREVIRAESPDVLALTEAAYRGSGGRVVRQDFARLLGMPHVACLGDEGEWANVLVSRFPIAHVEQLPLGGNPRHAPPTALRATLACDARAPSTSMSSIRRRT